MKGHSLYHRIRDELLEMGKDLKIKHSVSSPHYKVWGNFVHKKALHGGANLFGQILGGCFIWGLMIRSYKGEVNGYQGSFKGRDKLVFPLIDPDWVIDILFEKLTPQMGD